MCGKHTWAEASCRHGPHVEEESIRKPLAKSSKAMVALCKIVVMSSNVLVVGSL